GLVVKIKEELSQGSGSKYDRKHDSKDSQGINKSHEHYSFFLFKNVGKIGRQKECNATWGKQRHHAGDE
ncbi:MAG: hypothetical protein COU72_04125, partial [Parcubacteria group bacterium CG10_big_fil_rev_8_21_14_0_10_41_35]